MKSGSSIQKDNDTAGDEKLKQDSQRGPNQSDKNPIAKHRAEAAAYKTM